MCSYTSEEVSRHGTSISCWVIIHSKVYDVTDFLDQHPGGEEILLEHAGADVTNVFEGVGHTQDARDLAKQYLIGTITGQNDATAVKDSSEDRAHKEKLKESSSSCTVK